MIIAYAFKALKEPNPKTSFQIPDTVKVESELKG